jgi:hypothetical protein
MVETTVFTSYLNKSTLQLQKKSTNYKLAGPCYILSSFPAISCLIRLQLNTLEYIQSLLSLQRKSQLLHAHNTNNRLIPLSSLSFEVLTHILSC